MQAGKKPSVILTNSSSCMFNLCERAYYWRYEQELSQSAVPSYMELGRAYHEGVAALLTYRGKVSPARLLKKALDSLDQKGYDSDTALGARMLVRHFAAVALPKLAGYKVSSIEAVLTSPIHATGSNPLDCLIAGKLDGIAWDDDGQPWLIEHKTTARVDYEFLRKVSLDAQVSFYSLLWQMTSGTPPAGVLYCVMARPALYRRSGEDSETYYARAEAEYLAHPDVHFAIQKAYRDDRLLREKEIELSRIAMQMKQCRRKRIWVKNDNVCFLRERKCPYTDLCTASNVNAALPLFRKEVAHCELQPELSTILQS